MKLKIILLATFSLVLTVSAISAQQTKIKNFSGNWTLDTAKSKLSAKLPVESMTKTVLQTGKDIKIETKTTFPPSETAGVNNRRGSNMGGSSVIQTAYVYTLDGKETEFKTADGIDNAILKAQIEKNGQVKFSQTRRLNTQSGETTLKTVEVWTLSADGKTLTVKRDADSMSGDFMSQKVVTDSTEMVFTKTK